MATEPTPTERLLWIFVGLVLAAILVGVLAAFASLRFLLDWTWPAWPWLLAASAAWYLAARGWKNLPPWLRLLLAAARQTLAPITCGLLALALALIALNASHHLVSAVALGRVEHTLIDARLRLKDWNESLPLFFLLLAAALAISFVAPRLKALAALDRVRGAATATYVALLTVTSFTLFAQAPLQDLVDKGAADLSRRFAEEIPEYQLERRVQSDAVGRYLAARLLSRQPVTDAQRQQLASRLRAAQAAAAEVSVRLSEVFQCDAGASPPASPIAEQPGGLAVPAADLADRCDLLAKSQNPSDYVRVEKQAVRDQIVRSLARADWSLAPAATLAAIDVPAEDAPPLVLPASAEPPATLAEWRGRLAAEQGLRRRIAEVKSATERTYGLLETALKMAASQLIGHFLPEVPGLAGTYAAAVADQFTESGLDRLADLYVRTRATTPAERLPLPADLGAVGPFHGTETAGGGAGPPISSFAEAVRGQVRIALIRKTREYPPVDLLKPDELAARRRSELGLKPGDGWIDPLDPDYGFDLPQRFDPAHPAAPGFEPGFGHGEPVHPAETPP